MCFGYANFRFVMSYKQYKLKILLMKTFLIPTLLFISLSARSQKYGITDSTLKDMCSTLLSQESKLLPDTERIKSALIKHISPVLRDLTQSEQNDALDFVYYRTQRLCKEFKTILNRIEPSKGDWVSVEKKPVSNLTKEAYRAFLKIGKFYYLESMGDTVQVTLQNGLWEDHFKDGTYSRLKLHWLKDAEFQIEFIESNNIIRKNFSKPGDKYNYQLLEKYNKKYKMSVEIVGTAQFMTFYMYVK